MFQSARIKLTFWYLLIIIIITTLFSGGIYLNVSKELDRGFWRAQRQAGAVEVAQRYGISIEDLPHGFFEGNKPFSPEIDHYFLLNDDLEAAKRRLIWALLIVNGEVWLLAAIAGYFLAGKTLNPIARAMEDQQRFISDASHELRTPITALKTSIEVSLEDKDISKCGKDVLRDNLEDIENLETLTNHLLDLVTPTELNGPDITEVKMRQFVQKVTKKFDYQIKKNKQKLRISVKPKTLVMETDESSLSQIITILLDNALKYSSSSDEVFLSVEKQKKRVVIIIEDNGIGISEDDLPHIFDRFYRSDNARTKNGVRGYGLGLSMAKKIVKQLKGKMEAKSSLGEGTIFTLTLPQKLT